MCCSRSHEMRGPQAILQKLACPPWGKLRTIVTDKLKSYTVARRNSSRNRSTTLREREQSGRTPHQPTRVRERGMRRFKSMLQAQRFVRVHAAVENLFIGCHLVSADIIGGCAKGRLGLGMEQWPFECNPVGALRPVGVNLAMPASLQQMIVTQAKPFA